MERSASRVRAARRRRVVVAIAAALTLFLVADALLTTSTMALYALSCLKLEDPHQLVA